MREQERISAEEAAMRASVSLAAARHHPSYDLATDTVLFPKGNWFEKSRLPEFLFVCSVGALVQALIVGGALLINWAVGG